jgi:LexA-binding, inner membrane-associated putative hydrolase
MIRGLMPSPIAHALAGVVAAWTADLVPGDRAWRTAPPTASWYRRAGNGLTTVCAALGTAADLDLLRGGHRAFTHSIGAVFFVALFAAAMALKSRRPIARVIAMCAAAYATHLLLDWLAEDPYFPYGICALWPLSDRFYISGLDIFPQTARRFITSESAMRQNARAALQEIAIMGPVTVALWLVRVKALAGLAAQMARGHHPAK